jgi:hypothetical protein
MDKLAGRIIDFNDDPRFVTDLRAQGLYGQELVDIANLEKLPDSSFAVKIASGGHTHRRYPVYNRTATQLSATYLGAAADQGLEPEIFKVAAYHIKEACERFGLEVPGVAKDATDPGTRAVELTSAPTQGFKSVEKVAEYAQDRIAREFDRLGPERRTMAVQALVKAAGHDSIDRHMLWDYVPKAHLGPSFVRGMKAREVLVKRASEARSSLIGPLFDELIEDIQSMDAREAPRALGQFDKLAELDKRYKDGLPDPYQTCWGGYALPKEARASFDASVDDMLAPKEIRGSAVEYLVDLERRFPTTDVNFTKVATVASATVDSRPWPDDYKKAIRRHFA